MPPLDTQSQGPQEPQGPQGPATKIGPLTREEQGVYDSIIKQARHQGLQQQFDTLFADSARAYSEEAKGFLENARFQIDATTKAFGDGVARLGVSALKGLYMTGGLLNAQSPIQSSQEFDEWAEQTFHRPDPDLDDLVAGWAFRPEDLGGLTIGQHRDAVIKRRLGDAAAFGEAAGTIASFATGPGGMLGRGVHTAARPMALAAERAVAKRLARGAIEGADPKLVGQLLRSGQPLAALSKLPEWQQQATKLNRVMAWGGRHMTDVMSTTAALTAQSYAMSPHDERGQAAISALMTGPLIVPISIAGQKLGSRIMSSGLPEPSRRQIGMVLDDLAAGRVSPTAADARIRDIVPVAHRRAFANLVASSFEGAAFTWMMPESWHDLSAWYGGDSAAGTRLMAHWLGSATGIAVAKYAVPGELAPLFKHVRPDLNRIRTHAEAEAVRRSEEAKAQEPLPKETPERPLTEAEKAMVTSAEGLRQRLERSREAGDDVATTKWEADVARYDWADVTSLLPLRGGFRPQFDAFDGSLLRLSTEGHTVTLRRDGSVEMNPKTAAVLESFGRLPGAEKAESADRGAAPPAKVFRGPEAEAALEAIGLIGMLRTMEGNLAYERMQYREVRPGVWANDQNSFYHIRRLDGMSQRQDLQGKKSESVDLAVVGGYGKPDFHHPTLDRFIDQVMAKSSVHADPVVDGILNQAVLLAQHADSVGARTLRDFFKSVPEGTLDALMTPKHAEFLAAELGSLGSGTNNAPNAIREMTARLSGQEAGISASIAGTAHPPRIGPPQSPMLARDRVERLAAMHEERGNTDLATRLRSVLETGSPEAIAQAARQHGEGQAGSLSTLTPAQMRTAAEKAKKAGVSTIDWLITDRVEAMRREVGDDTFLRGVEEGRSIQRSLKGEAQDRFRGAEKSLKRLGRQAWETVEVDGTPTYRWVALAEGRIEPRSLRERSAAEGLRETVKSLWEAAREAGVRRPELDPSTGEVMWRPLRERDRAIVPRMRGADWDAVFDSPALRRQLFEWLIEKNDIRVPEGRGRSTRRITVEEMNERWKAEQAGPDVSTGERSAAFEFVRELKHFPSVFSGHRLLEANPFEAMRRLIHEQSGRVAAVRVFGQDLPAMARLAIEKAEGVKLKPGAESELRAFQGRQAEVGSKKTKVAEDVLVTLQGGTPNKRNAFFRAVAPLEGFMRSGMTMVTGIHDIPAPFVQGWAYAGAKRMWRAIGHMARSPRETMIAAERAGSLMRNMGSHDFREAEGSLQKMADLLSWASTKTEHLKTAVFDRMAVEMMADWGRGKVTGHDRDVLREMLRLRPEQVESLVSGQADKALQTRFRHEFVKMTTGRRTAVEGSEFIASPNAMSAIRFGNWISGRMVELARASKATVTGTRAQRARAMGRMAKLMTGWSAAGVATNLMYYMLTDLMKGEDGMKRFTKELTYAPGTMVWSGLKGQLMGGPVAMASRLFSEEKATARDWAQLTSPSSYMYALYDAWQDATAAAPLGLSRALGDGLHTAAATSGAMPSMVRNLAATVSAAIVGEDPVYRSDARQVRNFERLEEIRRPEFVANKSAEFYDVLRKVRRVITADSGLSAEERAKKAAQIAEGEIRALLALEPEESVAASIRTFQHLDGMSLENRAKLSEFVADDSTMTRIFAHDLAVREFANLVGRMHGEAPRPMAEDIEMASQMARVGDASVWGPLVDRALDDAVARVEAGEFEGMELRDVAEAAAAFPQQLGWLSDRQERALSKPSVGYTARSRMLHTILRRRLHDRVRDRRREAMTRE